MMILKKWLLVAAVFVWVFALIAISGSRDLIGLEATKAWLLIVGIGAPILFGLGWLKLLHRKNKEHLPSFGMFLTSYLIAKGTLSLQAVAILSIPFLVSFLLYLIFT